MSNVARPAKRKTAAEALVWGGAAVGVMVLLNILVAQSGAKLDATQYKIYSLTAASRGVVANMPEKVNIKAYFGNMPAAQAETQNYVDMLLQEYAEASDGKISYQRLDPYRDKALAEEVRKDGIQEIQLQVLQEDNFEMVPVYFQVVFSHLDKKEVWTPPPNFLVSLEGLEWEFTTRIKRLAYGKKKVGVTAGYGESSATQVLLRGDEDPRFADLSLTDIYEPSTVNWDKEPQKLDELDALIVNGPTEKVSDAALYHLDQFIMKGKPVLFLVSGMKWQGAGQQQMEMMPGTPQPYIGMPQESGVAALLKHYGFEVGQDVILDRQNYDVFVPPMGRGPYYKFIGAVATTDQKEPGDILAGIPGVVVPLASTLKLVGPLEKPGEDTTVIPLLRTQDTSWVQKEMLALQPQMQLKDPPADVHGPYLVGVAVKGKFKSFFAGKPAPAEPLAPPAEPSPTDGLDRGEADSPQGAPPAPAAGEESPSGTRIAVVTTPAIVADTSLITRNYFNGWKAAHAIIDWLVADQDLAAARAKTVRRPIDKLTPAKRDLVKVANIASGPVLLIAFGIVYWRVRERRRKNVKL